MNSHDPLPRILDQEFGFTAEEQVRCRNVRELPQLLEELRADLPAMHRYLVVARLALECPPIWGKIASSLHPNDDPDEQAAALELKYRNSRHCLEAPLQLIRRVTSKNSSLTEELHLRQLALQGLFARLGHTVRSGMAPRPAPGTPASAPFESVSPELAQLLLLAVSLIDHLPYISDHGLVHGLPSLSFTQASARLPLFQRLIGLPPDRGISLSEEEALVLYQSAQVTLLALLVELTPEGTWADWVASRIVNPDPPRPFVSTYEQDKLDMVTTTGPADLQAFCQRVQAHFGTEHPDFAQAAAEVRELTELL
ncbi:hypothetical protein GCM10028821_34470 [Hymenobacter jeollabukensis]